ncbi:hypothetical protein [Asticcacaulis sp. YBE204]|uniref:hypothetical protein n=1 Tax=Asticcacaulis sp. YBE204 TaxID=1282363 RepID=UPI0003C3ACA8|nr:hypothetical protein [Asticcacaulis sp. YBE204]ESQ77016.1 hypothetical protein AEYBE204_18175 [Asticcacaulis sp. YBE204]
MKAGISPLITMLVHYLAALVFPRHRFKWDLDISASEAERRLRRATDPRRHYTPFDQDIGLFRGEIETLEFNLKLKGLNESNFPTPRIVGMLEPVDERSILYGQIKALHFGLVYCVMATGAALWLFGGWMVVRGNMEMVASSLTAGIIAFAVTSFWRLFQFNADVKDIKAALRTALSGDESRFYPFSG